MKIRSSAAVKEQPSKGTHWARVVGISDIGHQPGFTWSGGDVESQFKIEITYELVESEMEDGRPFWVSEEVKNSDNENSNLTARAAALGVPVREFPKAIGKPCMVALDINDKGYPKIINVSGVPSSMTLPELRNPTVLFDIYAVPPQVELYNSFSDFKKSKIQSALDFKDTPLYLELLKQGEDTGEDGDDI